VVGCAAREWWTRLTLFQTRFDRVLAAAVGGGLFLQGLAELLLRLDEPGPLIYWLPTLWGGALLVLVGSFRINRSDGVSRAMVLLGSALGFLPSAWTLVMPVLIVALIFRATLTSGRRARLPD
jgi:hypothetical protein